MSAADENRDDIIADLRRDLDACNTWRAKRLVAISQGCRVTAHGVIPNSRRVDGIRMAAPVGCLCGWQSASTNGWDGLAELFDHFAALRPDPPADPVADFLRPEGCAA